MREYTRQQLPLFGRVSTDQGNGKIRYENVCIIDMIQMKGYINEIANRYYME